MPFPPQESITKQTDEMKIVRWMGVLGINGIRRVFDGSQSTSINCVSPSSRIVFATIGTIFKHSKSDVLLGVAEKYLVIT